jgi:hypothetical protein
LIQLPRPGQHEHPKVVEWLSMKLMVTILGIYSWSRWLRGAGVCIKRTDGTLAFGLGSV